MIERVIQVVMLLDFYIAVFWFMPYIILIIYSTVNNTVITNIFDAWFSISILAHLFGLSGVAVGIATGKMIK